MPGRYSESIYAAPLRAKVEDAAQRIIEELEKRNVSGADVIGHALFAKIISDAPPIKQNPSMTGDANESSALASGEKP